MNIVNKAAGLAIAGSLALAPVTGAQPDWPVYPTPEVPSPNEVYVPPPVVQVPDYPPPPVEPVYEPPPVEPVDEEPVEPVYEEPVKPVYEPPVKPVYEPPPVVEEQPEPPPVEDKGSLPQPDVSPPAADESSGSSEENSGTKPDEAVLPGGSDETSGPGPVEGADAGSDESSGSSEGNSGTKPDEGVLPGGSDETSGPGPVEGADAGSDESSGSSEGNSGTKPDEGVLPGGSDETSGPGPVEGADAGSDESSGSSEENSGTKPDEGVLPGGSDETSGPRPVEGADEGSDESSPDKIVEPQMAEAPPEDLVVAKASEPVQQQPPPAPQSEVDRIRSLVTNPADPSANDAPTAVAANSGGDLTSNVKQWQSDWVQYDKFFRPVIFNPYRYPLQIVYLVAGVPRILVIPPLGSIVTEAAEPGAHCFTAVVLNPVGKPTNVAAGSFIGGGYVPEPGQPPPAPPPVKRYDDVPVQVKYTNATYKPFRVQKIVDIGDDPNVGERKVLLDGVTPAWGVWKQNDTGERQFEVHKTQQFPGLDDPQEAPLPGDYQIQLASDSSSGLSTKDVFLIAAAAVVAMLGLGAIVLTIFLGRRRPHH